MLVILRVVGECWICALDSKVIYKPFVSLKRAQHTGHQYFLIKRASPRAKDFIALKRVARHTIKCPPIACKYPWSELDSNIEVFGDANFPGCVSTRKSTVGGVAMWSGQFVKAWFKKTMDVLALTSGEPELAAVVRAATEEMGRQSIFE